LTNDAGTGVADMPFDLIRGRIYVCRQCVLYCLDT
ncbi:MAG: hypothetical protein QOF15_3465, partial [Mycobacterium sp.]|nr:hypothetical protein [Mycobacterium sp.]